MRIFAFTRRMGRCKDAIICGGTERSDSNFHIFAIHSREYYYSPVVKGAWVFPMKYAALSRNVPREADLSRVSAFSSEPERLIE